MNEIPNGWIDTKIEDVAEYVQRGKSPKYIDKSDLPVINQKCIRWSGVDPRYLKFIHPDQWDSWTSERFLREGDILWNSTGTGTIGRAALYKNLDGYERVVVDSHVTIVRANEACDSRFLHYFIRSSLVQSKIEDMQSGSTNQVELSRGQVINTVIPIAPLNEQKRIADKLDRLLAKVDNCRERIDRIPLILKRFRQSVLATAISGELTRDWRDEKELCYEDWQSFVLGDIVDEVRNGISVKPDEKPLGVSILRISSVRPFNVNFDDSRLLSSEAALDIYLLEFDDLLFTRYNGTLEFVGVCARVKKLPSYPVVYPDKVIRVRVDKSLAIAGFIEIVANSPVSRKFIEGLAKTSAGQTGISGKDLKSLSVILPTSPEQKEIVRRVEKLFNFADRLEARYQTARAQIDKLTPALLAKAFRGELVPQDPTDEPAATLLAKIQST